MVISDFLKDILSQPKQSRTNIMTAIEIILEDDLTKESIKTISEIISNSGIFPEDEELGDKYIYPFFETIENLDLSQISDFSKKQCPHLITLLNEKIDSNKYKGSQEEEFNLLIAVLTKLLNLK
jgi:hypothetical protein